ncbi:ABC transporter ATP-binding protein [Gordonia malaquae]|jgi:ATP-binding cassette subfamily B protein IrtB|uniref:ABC transporter ATP-binding protein n=1 Tax=Gordonia TaxID=2053 RepID=UPI00301A428F
MTLPLTDIVARMRRMLSQPSRLRGALAVSVGAGLIEGLALAALLPAISSLASDDAVWGLRIGGWVAVLAVLSVASFAVNYFAARRMYDAALDFLRSIHRLVGDQVAKQPLGWFARPISGALSRLVSTELMMAGEILAHMLGPLASRGTAAAVIVIAAWVWNPLLGLVLTVAAPVFVGITLGSTALLRRGREMHEPSEIALADRIVEFAQCQGALRSTGHSADFAPLAADMEAASKAKKSALWMETGGLLLSGAATQGIVVALIVTAGSLAVDGVLEPIPAVAFIGLALRFTLTLSVITDSAMALESRRPLLDQLDEVLTARPLPEPNEPAVLGAPGSIVLDNVGFTYEGSAEPALQNISLTVPPGKMVAIVGPSGSGKTTLAKLIARFYDADQGTVAVGGASVAEQTTEQLMSQLSMVFQDAYLFDGTLWSNIAVGRPEASDAEILEAAESAGVTEVAGRLSDGWDTGVGEGGRALSGGERQRVSLARALLKQAPIVLLDEATSALDVENEAHVVHAVEQLRRTATVVVIAHRLDTVVSADTIVSLDESGRLEAVGDHDELLAAGGTYASFWQRLRSSQGWRVAD